MHAARIVVVTVLLHVRYDYQAEFTPPAFTARAQGRCWSPVRVKGRRHLVALLYWPTPSQGRSDKPIARVCEDYTVLPATQAFINEWNEP